MSPELWQRITTIWDEYFDLRTDQQAVYLCMLHENDPEAAAEFDALLVQQIDSHTTYLTVPPADLLEETSKRDFSSAETAVPPISGSEISTSDDKQLAKPAHPSSESTGFFPTIPDYEIVREIARGGMGVVYEARDKKLDRRVAVKMILPNQQIAKEHLARFQTEAQAIARINHPHIVQVHASGDVGGTPYLVLEFVDGDNLKTILNGQPLPHEKAAHLVSLLAKAVHSAHDKHVVHRDLKPDNVLFGPEAAESALNTEYGCPKITDFGLAKRLDSGDSTTEIGMVMGTPRYMSPEQAAGETDKISPATDVHALGVILYECLTGKTPYVGETKSETIFQIISKPPAPPSVLRSDIPTELEAICLKCLEKAQSNRYETATELGDDLQRFYGGDLQPSKYRLPIARWFAAAASILVALSMTIVFAWQPWAKESTNDRLTNVDNSGLEPIGKNSNDEKLNDREQLHPKQAKTIPSNENIQPRDDRAPKKPIRPPQSTVIKGSLGKDDANPRDPSSHLKAHVVSMARENIYVISMTAEFSAMLKLEDEFGNEIAKGNNGGAGLNSRMVFHPAKAGKFRILVISADKLKKGAYQIHLTAHPISFAAEPVVVLSVERTLSEKDPFDRLLNNSRSHEHIVELKEGKFYSIEAKSLHFDTFLRLTTTQQRKLMDDDDSGAGSDSLLAFQPAKSDRFCITVTTNRPKGLGKYQLVVREGTGHFIAAKQRILDSQMVMKNNKLKNDEKIVAKLGRIAGNLTTDDDFDAKRKQSYHRQHYLKFVQGETYVIDMTSKTFDTYLRLEDAEGKELVFDDDGGDGLNSRLTFRPKRSAVYRIIATSYTKATGEYQIAFSPEAQVLKTNSDFVFSANQFLSSRDVFDSVKRNSYSQEIVVRLEEGKYYTFETHSTQIDTYLRLRNPSGQTLKYDDDSGPGLNSLITYRPISTGQYRVVVTTYRGRQTGSYNLTVYEGRTRFDMANYRMNKETLSRTELNTGWDFVAKKQYAKAISTADAVLKKYPNYGSAIRLKGRVYYLQGKDNMALPLFEEAIRLEPNNCLAYNARGNVYFEKRNYRQAIADYTTAIRLDPESAVYYANRANAYELNGQEISAGADIKKALSLKPGYQFAKDVQRILDAKRLYGDQTGVVEFKNLSNRSIKYQIRWKDYRDRWTDWKLWTITANGRFWNWMKGATSCELRFDTDGSADSKLKSYTLKFYRYPSSRKIQQGMGRPYRIHWVGNEIWISESKQEK